MIGVPPAVAMLYTNNPVAGFFTGAATLVAVNATRGGKNPLLLLLTSNCADESGLFVPIPTCATMDEYEISSRTIREEIFFTVSFV